MPKDQKEHKSLKDRLTFWKHDKGDKGDKADPKKGMAGMSFAEQEAYLQPGGTADKAKAADQEKPEEEAVEAYDDSDEEEAYDLAEGEEAEEEDEEEDEQAYGAESGEGAAFLHAIGASSQAEAAADGGVKGDRTLVMQSAKALYIEYLQRELKYTKASGKNVHGIKSRLAEARAGGEIPASFIAQAEAGGEPSRRRRGGPGGKGKGKVRGKGKGKSKGNGKVKPKGKGKARPAGKGKGKGKGPRKS